MFSLPRAALPCCPSPGAAHVVTAPLAASLCPGSVASGSRAGGSVGSGFQRDLSTPAVSLCPCSAICQHDPPGTLPHGLPHQRQLRGWHPPAGLHPLGEHRGHGADQPHHGGFVLRSTPAADVSFRAISHPSASRQHPPAPWTSSTRALASSGSICLLCRWPHPLSGTGEGEGLRPAVTHGSALVLTLPSIGLAPAWEGGWQGDRARMG